MCEVEWAWVRGKVVQDRNIHIVDDATAVTNGFSAAAFEKINVQIINMLKQLYSSKFITLPPLTLPYHSLMQNGLPFIFSLSLSLGTILTCILP